MPFYRDRMALHGVIMIVPEEPDLQAIHDLIYTDLTRGVVTAEGRALATRVTADVLARGAQAAVEFALAD